MEIGDASHRLYAFTFFFCYSVHVSVSSIHTIHWYHIECNGISYTNKRKKKTAPCWAKQINESTSKRSITAQILCKRIMLLWLSDDKNGTVSPANRIHFNCSFFFNSTRMDFIPFAICLVWCFHIFRIEWEMPSDTLKKRDWGNLVVEMKFKAEHLQQFRCMLKWEDETIFDVFLFDRTIYGLIHMHQSCANHAIVNRE